MINEGVEAMLGIYPLKLQRNCCRNFSEDSTSFQPVEYVRD